MLLVFSNKGGQLKEVKLKEFSTHDSLPVYLVKEDNANFNVNFQTTNGQVIDTERLMFSSQVEKKDDGSTELKLTSKLDGGAELEYAFYLKKDDYLVDFDFETKGLSQLINEKKTNEA